MNRHLKYMPVAVLFATCNKFTNCNKVKNNEVPSDKNDGQVIEIITKTQKPYEGKVNNPEGLQKKEDIDNKGTPISPQNESKGKFNTPLEQLLNREATFEENKFWDYVQLNDKNEMSNIPDSYSLLRKIENQDLLNFALNNVLTTTSDGIISEKNFRFIKDIIPKITNHKLICDTFINAVASLSKTTKNHGDYCSFVKYLITNINVGHIDKDCIKKAFVHLFRALCDANSGTDNDYIFRNICSAIFEKIKNDRTRSTERI